MPPASTGVYIDITKVVQNECYTYQISFAVHLISYLVCQKLRAIFNIGI